MQEFQVVEKEQVVPVEAIDSSMESEASNIESDAPTAVDSLFKLPVVSDEASASKSSERAAKVLLALVAAMVASQLLVLGVALLVPRTRTIRVSSLVVSDPGTLVLKQESSAGIDLLFIFFHPIPSLIEVTRKQNYGFFDLINAGVERAVHLRDFVGRSLFEWAAELVASRPYQQIHKLVTAAMERLGLPA